MVESGRHTGLKIPRAARSMPVQFRLPAPKLNNSALFCKALKSSVYLSCAQTVPIPLKPPPLSKGLKRCWSHFIRKAYETDSLVCPKCSGEMRIISFIDQADVIEKILQYLGLWEESLVPPDRGLPKRKITFDLSYSQLIQRPHYLKIKECPSLPRSAERTVRKLVSD